MLRRAAIALVAPLFVVVLTASCGHHDDYANCDYVDRHCRTVCDTWCDGWGCYPDCWDECWDECGTYARTPAPPAPADAAPPPDAAAPPPASGSGVLCSPCASNSDCAQGALCIVRGGSTPDSGVADAGDAEAGDAGAPAASGFCGSPCQSANDCPQAFACVQIGDARQCLPTSANCK